MDTDSTGQWTPTRDLTILPCASPRPVTVAAVAMLTPRTASLLTLLLAVGSLGQRAQRPPRPPSPISTIQPKANFDTQQVDLEKLEQGLAQLGSPRPRMPSRGLFPVFRDLVPCGRGLLVPLPAGAGPPG